MRIATSSMFLFLLIAGCLFLLVKPERPPDPAAFLPVDTLVYFEQQQGMKAVEQFEESAIGQSLGRIRYRAALGNLGVSQLDIAKIDLVKTGLRLLRNNELFQQLLGERLAIGVYPERSWTGTVGDLQRYLHSHTLLISQPLIPEKSLHNLISHTFREYQQSKISFGSQTLHRIAYGDSTLAYVFIRGYLLASFEERVVREALIRFTTGQASLENDTDFVKISREMDSSDRLFYFRIDGLQDMAEYAANRLQSSRTSAILKEFANLRGLLSFGYGGWRGKATIHDKVLVTLDTAPMDPAVEEMISTRPSINDTLPFVAEDVLLYYWSNTLNSRLLWDMYMAEAGENSQTVAKVEYLAESITGVDLDGLISMVSSNVGFLLRQSGRQQFVPIPDFAILVQLNEPEKIDSILSQSLKKLDINVQNREYKGIDYYSWGLYAQESLQPVYAVHRNYLILANTFDILKAIVDTPVNGKGLIGSSSFTEIDPGFQRLNNSVCYVNQKRLLSHIRELIRWSGTLLAIQDREAVEKSKILVEDFIHPLFTGMAMYSRSATRTYINESSIYIESQTATSSE